MPLFLYNSLVKDKGSWVVSIQLKAFEVDVELCQGKGEFLVPSYTVSDVDHGVLCCHNLLPGKVFIYHCVF